MFAIGIITDQVSMDFERALRFIREQGIEFVEIHALWDKNIEELDDDETARAQRLVDSFGLKVSNISSTLFLQCHLDGSGGAFRAIDDYFITISGDEAAHMRALERCIRLADLFRCDKVRAFGFVKEGELSAGEAVSRVADKLAKAVRAVERAGLTLLLENCPHTYLTTGSLTRRVIEELGSASVRALWDPGNALRSGADPFPGDYERVRHLIAHVHAKDLSGGARPRIVPLGEGTLDYGGIFRRLAEDGYGGVVSIEPEYVDEKGGRPGGCRRSLEGVRRILSSLET